MDPVIFTSRLKLTLVLKAERGSPEFKWLHELRSEEKTTWWSIMGRSKSEEDTERVLKSILPDDSSGEQKSYKVVYAVHELLEQTTDSATTEARPDEQDQRPTRFIGHVNIYSLNERSLPLPKDCTHPDAAAPSTLAAELAYSFLPAAWGKGYAPEALAAFFEACERARSFWAPFTEVYIRAIVNEENPASVRVMEKTGLTRRGIYYWTGEPIWLAGRWQERSTLYIFDKILLK